MTHLLTICVIFYIIIKETNTQPQSNDVIYNLLRLYYTLYITLCKVVVLLLWGKIMIYENIKKFCAIRGVTIRKLEKDLEFGRGSISKFDDHDPSVGKMNMIAGYLGVTVDDLIGNDHSAGSKIDQKALQMYGDQDMRDIYRMKESMTQERFAVYKKLLSEIFTAESGNKNEKEGDAGQDK